MKKKISDIPRTAPSINSGRGLRLQAEAELKKQKKKTAPAAEVDALRLVHAEAKLSKSKKGKDLGVRDHLMKIIKSTRSMVPLFMLALCMFALLFPLANGLVKAQGVSAATPVKKTVLALFPYQIDLPVSMIATQAIREEFGNTADLKLDVYYEYLDLNRFPDPAYRQQLLDLYKAKYQSKQVDLVMVGSESMLNLWLAQRAEILPDTPIVFFDITTERLNALELPSDVTGVSGVDDYTKSVQWVLDKLPAVNEVVIVHGVGQVDQGFIQPVQTLQEKMQGQIKFTDLSNLPLSEIKQRIAELPKTSIVLYHLMFEDAGGNKYRPIDALRELTAVSAVPVISGYDQFIGTGSIGGYMYSIDHQARDAAQIGLRILRGEAAGVIPIEKDRSDRFIFDHLALQRFDIPISLLPADSIIKNRQYSTWELYRTQIILVSVSFVFLLMLVAFLGAATQRLNKARSDLKRFNANLESQVQERTTLLSQTNHDLVLEITARKQAESQGEAALKALREEEKLSKQMVTFTEDLIKTGNDQVTYQNILENLLDISKAKYGALTLLNDSTGKFTTVAVAGIKDSAKKISKMFGFELVGKEWNEYSTENEQLKGQVVSHFSSMSELAGRVMPETISKPIEKLLNMGEVTVTKIIVNNKMIGDFTLIMPAGKQFENDTFVEIYSRQIDMFITRIKVEEALRESENKWHSLFEILPVGVSIVHSEKGITDFNPSLAQILDISKEGLLRGDYKNRKYLRPDKTPMSAEEFPSRRATKEQKIIQNIEVGVEKENGVIIWTNVSAAPLSSGNGTVVVTSNITERKRIDDKLRESEDRYRRLVENAPDIVYTFSNQRGSIYCSPRVEQILGYSAEHLYAHPMLWNESIHPDDRPRVSRVIGDFEVGKFFDIEYRIQNARGNWLWLRDRSIGREVDNGEVLVEGLATDITERKQAEEKLREVYWRTESIIEGTQVGTWEWNVQTGETVFNEKWAQIIGYTLDELAPISIKTWEKFAHPEDLKQSDELLERHFAGELPNYEYESRMKHKDGHWVWVLDRGRVITRTSDGKPLMMFGTHQDISERRRIEEEIQQINATLEQRVEERTQELRDAQEQLVRKEKLAVLGQMAGSVGHELRNPLAVIANAVFFLKMVQPDANDKVKQYLDMIASEVRISDKIVEDLMSFTRAKSVDRKPASVSELILQTLERFPAPASVEVALEILPDLPQVFADPQHVVQILGNLTINACQSMAEGGKLTISAKLQGDMVIIAVQDTGSGITPENMKKLFEPLFTTKTKGIGLGLAVCQKLAEANGGMIEVESEVGKGSMFSVWLPIQ